MSALESSLDHLGDQEQENAADCNIDHTLIKRNAALRETRTMLAKAEEERSEYWRKLQVELREKKALAVKLFETQALLDDLTEQFKKSESNRKALSRTLQKTTIRDSPAKPSPKVMPSPAKPAAPDQSIELKAENATLSQALQQSHNDLEIEKEKTTSLKAAVKAKVDRFNQVKDELESSLSEARWSRDTALADSESLRQLVSKQESEILHLKQSIAELEEFKVIAMREWMNKTFSN